LVSAIAKDCKSRAKIGEAIFSTLKEADSTVKVQYGGLVLLHFSEKILAIKNYMSYAILYGL
jgi:hypothetical protein